MTRVTPGAAGAVVARRESAPHAESIRWRAALRAAGGEREIALAELYARLLRVARSELHRRSATAQVYGVELDDLAHQAAGDALLAIDAKLESFRGESLFTTWAYAFVVLEVSKKLGRHFWRRAPTALDGEQWERLPERFGLDPAARAEWAELLAALRTAVDEQLSDRQRRVFVAVVLNGVPLDALVAELDTNRNALYKTMFDARRKLFVALVASGHLEAER